MRVSVGKRYGGGDPPTIYRVDAIEGEDIRVTIIAAPHMPKRKVGHQRTVPRYQFERWIEREFVSRN